MEFQSPALLHLLWILVLYAALLLWYWYWRRGTLRRLGSPALEQRLLLGFSETRFWIKNLLFALALILVVVAIANPRQAIRREPPPQDSADILIALDVSMSMQARDIKPSRMEQARQFADDLTQSLQGERLGLIFFAGDAYPQMPLSTDYEALRMFIRNANPALVNDQGTDIATAIDLAGRLFESKSTAGRALILISDGENQEPNAIERAKAAREAGIVIHTISLGTAGGAQIPTPDGGAKRTATGQTINTSANASFLLEIAQAGGGMALPLSQGQGAITQLKSAVSSMQKATVAAQAYTEYVSLFPWLILPALLLLGAEQLLRWRMKPQSNL